MAILAPPDLSARNMRSALGAYVALTKPRIIELLLITTVPTMVVAKHGLPPIGLMVATVIGGALAAGGANAINMVVDRDIDRLMNRTKKRPLVTGAMSSSIPCGSNAVPRRTLSSGAQPEQSPFLSVGPP